MRLTQQFRIAAVALLTVMSCTTTPDEPSNESGNTTKPLIEISNIISKAESVSFVVTPTDAVEYQYSVVPTGDAPSYTSVISSKEKEINVTNLEQGVEYEISAYSIGIDLNESDVVSATFVTEAVESYPRTSLAYKFTATWCTFCPYMTETLATITADDPTALAIVAIHNENEASKDYNTVGGNAIIDEWNIASLPTTTIDYREDCNYKLDILNGAIKRSKSYQTTSNIAISSKIEDNKLTVTVETKYGATARYKVGAVITENNISEPNTEGSYDGLYHHVARQFLSEPFGDLLGKVALGETRTNTYECTLAEGWDVDNLEITAFVLKEEKTNCYYTNNAAVAAVGSSVEYK